MEDFNTILISIKLAFVSAVILLSIALPLAWALSRSTSNFKPIIEALVSLPLVLPPTVLGFYLILFLGNNSFFGKAWFNLFDETLIFSFSSLVIASVIYSFPFVMQPLKSAFDKVSVSVLEAGYSLRASKIDVFINVVVPQCRQGIISAFVLGFFHVIGEFGVVLMVGGNIEGSTRVVSIAIYDHVESLNYTSAHQLSLLLLGVSFLALLFVYILNNKSNLNT